MTVAVAGANGHLGRRLLPVLAEREPVRALVRSERAAAVVRDLELSSAVDVRVVDYTSAAALAAALEGCRAVVHLVGIIREGAGNRYRDAHENACRALVEAAHAAGVARIVHLSLVGAEAASPNACLASRAAAESILLDASVPATVIRVPMVLGEGDYASAALAGRARRSVSVVLRGQSLEQPIYAGDVVAALVAALDAPQATGMLELAGPESLSRTALTHRAARVLGRRARVVSLPLWLGMAAAGLLERLSANPPVTRDMLGVLDNDDRINTGPATRALGLRLTPLDETLRRCLGAPR